MMSDTPRELATASENQRQLTGSPLNILIPTSLSDAEARLRPATAQSGTAELTACLTLVAPSGMSAEDRNAWVQVARATLSGIPADLLAYGCKKARERCRFASEIVPMILDETKAMWDLRRRTLETQKAQFANRFAPRLESNPDYVDPAEVRNLIKSLASK